MNIQPESRPRKRLGSSHEPAADTPAADIYEDDVETFSLASIVQTLYGDFEQSGITLRLGNRGDSTC